MVPNKKKKTTNKKNPQKQSNTTNGWDVIIHFIDHLFNLISLGNMFGALMFGFIAILLILLVKYPNAELPTLTIKFGTWIQSERYYIFPLGFCLLISAYANFICRKTYKKEIERMAEENKKLRTGLTEGNFMSMNSHYSSRED